jgi:hypothetical protein
VRSTRGTPPTPPTDARNRRTLVGVVSASPHLHHPTLHNRIFNWESVERVSKYRETDGAAVFATVTTRSDTANNPRLIIIAQWRPPLRKFVLEVRVLVRGPRGGWCRSRSIGASSSRSSRRCKCSRTH